MCASHLRGLDIEARVCLEGVVVVAEAIPEEENSAIRRCLDLMDVVLGVRRIAT